MSDRHLEKISRSLCKEWKRLYPYLGMTSIEVHDIVCKQVEENVKRHAFFLKWKEKGSKATYKALLGALLEINSRDDSEGICKLLQEESLLEQPSAESNSVVSVAAGSSTIYCTCMVIDYEYCCTVDPPTGKSRL